MADDDEEQMIRIHHRLLIFLFLLCVPSLSCSSADADVMADLAKSLTNLPTSWNPATNPCGGGGGGGGAWEGVTCDSEGHVTDINLAGQSLGGTLPSDLGQLSSLQNLLLHQNQISGALPSLSGLSSLQSISIFSNEFSSIPSDFFSGVPALQRVFLDNNPFAAWSLLDDLAQCGGLTVFSASNANITGPIPSYFGSMLELQSLQLSYNNLSGELPATFAGSAIESLWLNNQQPGVGLTGAIEVVGSMVHLSLIRLQSNGFTGVIPDVSKLTSLSDFDVSDNSLTGLVPPSLISCPTLKNVSISNNFLQGSFPAFSTAVTADVENGNSFCNRSPGVPCDSRVSALLAVEEGFGYPKFLASSWAGDNPCTSGWIGILCDTTGENVTVVNLPDHSLTGTISPAISNLTSLTELILNNNDLIGPIPDSLTSLPHLQLLDFTNNNLSGTVPSFASTVILRLSGNALLVVTNASSGGTPDSPGGGSNDGSSPSPSSSPGGTVSQSSPGGTVSEHEHGICWSAGKIAGISIAIAALLALLVGLFLFRKHRGRKRQSFVFIQQSSPHPRKPETVKADADQYLKAGSKTETHNQSFPSTAVSSAIEPQRMTISMDVLRLATDNFSEENILGRGGFGVVYKGDLNGTMVAVKRSESDSMGTKGVAEFEAEIGVLSRVRHRHLVALLGYCVHGNERLLVYEYVPEGTLGEHLFNLGDGRSRRLPLTWKQRLSIALDVSRGVEYLHSLARESFIHRDLKPSNILLDKEMHAKVSDFGLVKLADTKDKSMMTKLAGTFGYLAPEYAITGKLSTKIDVYAFGVILMELITGRRAVESSQPEEETHLVTYFRRNILDCEKFINSVDSSLVLFDEDDRKSILQVSELACHCTHREPYGRPDMGHIVNILSPLVHQWNPGSYTDDGGGEDDPYLNTGTGLNERLERWQNGYSTSMTDFSTNGSSTIMGGHGSHENCSKAQ